MTKRVFLKNTFYEFICSFITNPSYVRPSLLEIYMNFTNSTNRRRDGI